VADNVQITAGSGTVVASDELTINAIAAQVQRMKLALGADGTYTGDLAGRLVSGSDGAMYVDPRVKAVRLAATPTVSTTPAYTAKDAVGGLMTFANAARISGGTFMLNGLTLLDKGQQMKDLELFLFDRSITAPIDNSIFAPTDTELSYCVAQVLISAGFYGDLSTNSVATLSGINKEITLNGTDLYGVLVARGTPTYTSTTDLVLALDLIQD
jgi:hypothetical protein